MNKGINKQPSQEALTAFQFAEDAYQTCDADNIASIRDAASIYTVAIKKLGDAYLPKAHRHYGELLYMLEQFDLAQRHLEVAVQQDPRGINGFFAQHTKIQILGAKGVKSFSRNLGPNDFIHNRGMSTSDGFAQTVMGTIFKSLVAGGVSASILKSQSDFWREVTKLGELFQEVHKSNTDAQLFCSMVEAMIQAGDYVASFMKGKDVNLYKFVADVTIDKLQFRSNDEVRQVRMIYSKAVGRAELF